MLKLKAWDRLRGLVVPIALGVVCGMYFNLLYECTTNSIFISHLHNETYLYFCQLSSGFKINVGLELSQRKGSMVYSTDERILLVKITSLQWLYRV